MPHPVERSRDIKGYSMGLLKEDDETLVTEKKYHRWISLCKSYTNDQRQDKVFRDA